MNFIATIGIILTSLSGEVVYNNQHEIRSKVIFESVQECQKHYIETAKMAVKIITSSMSPVEVKLGVTCRVEVNEAKADELPYGQRSFKRR